jgi:patatin-related protein
MEVSMSASPKAEYTQEVRFAVVMYGGVSLAIYINGIAQELLSLVRSTSSAGRDKDGTRVPLSGSIPDTNDPLALKPTERVYRQLSYLLANKSLLAECRRLAQSEANVPAPNKLTAKLEQLAGDDNRPITLRFVVDILSGTSAGGINAIYLAKALANDQSIEQLKQLWINEGDIGVLINDRKSVNGLKLQNQNPPQSLLNSRRMYLKLLKSFDDMESPNPVAEDSPHVDEIDLFITTTDIAGTPLPIRLSDTVVYERRHRNVFHFKYASHEVAGDELRNDFDRTNNPFLAFAARCTSSFPFAFEPMKLADIDEVLDTFNDYRSVDRKDMKKKWARFFKEKVESKTVPSVEFSERSFGDGGYLDNKPFTYATETLARRYSPLPVDRKLIYIEPSPEHPEDERVDAKKPDALANVKSALLDLPAYETIREDLQRLLQRNNLINRINRITAAVDQDLDQAGYQRPKLKTGEWETLDLAGMVNKFGVYYLPYRRLRIAAVTDALAYRVTRVLEIEEDSAGFFAVRVLIRAWREQMYPDYHRTTPAPATETDPTREKTPEELLKEEESKYTANQLLLHYDFSYWLRRLNFIGRKVDALYKLNDFQPTAHTNSNDPAVLCEEEKTIYRLKKISNNEFDYLSLSDEQKTVLHRRLVYIRNELRDGYKAMRIAGRQLQARYKEGDTDTIAAKIKAIPLGKEQLRWLLGLPLKPTDNEQDYSKLNEEECLIRARELFKKPEFQEPFIAATRALRIQMLATIINPVYEKGKALFRPAPDPEVVPGGPPPPPVSETDRNWKVIQKYLWRYFSQFDDFDQIAFPILYGVEEGESDVVEVIRISPEDATTLINERRERKNSADGVGRRKLAGSALHHFGAFLDRTWRQNDIMWGRLDGAERLVTALLPDPADKLLREEMIRQAHVGILKEEMAPKNHRELGNLMSDALLRASAGEPMETAIAKVIGDLDAGSSVRKRLETVLCNSLKEEELLRFIANGYEVNRQLDAKMMLRAMSRSTQVIGHVFEDIANQNSLDGKSLAWIARLGQMFWGLVEVAVPGSILNLLMMHWLKVLYVLEVVLIVLCFLFSAPAAMQTFALKIFAVTVTINIAVLLLRDRMRGKGGWLKGLLFAAIGLIVLLALIGLADLLGFGLSQKIIGWFQPVINAAHVVKEWLRPVRDVLAKLF